MDQINLTLDEELYRRVDEVLHYLWDPIAVRGIPEARSEYASYVPRVVERLKCDVSVDDLQAFLSWVATDQMGLHGNAAVDREIAEVLVNWAEVIRAKQP